MLPREIFPLVWSLTHPGIDPEPRKSHVECRAKRCFLLGKEHESVPALQFGKGVDQAWCVLCNVSGLV